MNREILLIAEQLKDAYEGSPWFGKPATGLLAEIDEHTVFQKPAEQHSILEILWHMTIWKEFTISRIRKDSKEVHYFEAADWRELNHTDKKLWQQGLQQFHQIHNELVEVLQQQKDDLLVEIVKDRSYNFRKLLKGIIQHDIYHLGQIAYINKLIRSEREKEKNNDL